MAKMEASDNRNAAKIAFDLPPVGCLEQLVNNQYKADVVFKVGQSGELIYAHKLIITMASEVFFAQFNGGFSEAHRDTLTDPVVIDDIEPAPFLQLLRYMYCREVDITAGNMLDISYASKKYMLRKLEIRCDFVKHTNETNVLTVFQQNRRYGISAVDDLCLRIICENPLKFFKQDGFLALNLQAMELIASRSAMNCRIDHLKQAINRWKRNDGCKSNVNIDVKLKKLLCRRLHFHDKGAYGLNIDTRFTFTATTAELAELYGIGIFVGVENDCPPISDNTVTVRVDLNGISIKEKVQVTDELKVHEIMFEKQVIKGRCDVSVKVVKQDCLKNYKMFHLNGVSTANSIFTNTNVYRYSQVNCVAYIMIK